MSLDPTPPAALAPGPEPLPQGPRHSWLQKVSAVLFCVFCFEVGLFLLVYPWTNPWKLNYFLNLRPEWRPLLLSEGFRGAVSGLGILNIFIALLEVFRLRRFAGR
jgi:hypothetical protein